VRGQNRRDQLLGRGGGCRLVSGGDRQIVCFDDHTVGIVARHQHRADR